MKRRLVHVVLAVTALVGFAGLVPAEAIDSTWSTTTDKKINGQDSFTGEVGDTVTVTITATADGDDPYGQQTLTIRDELPNCLDYVAGSGIPSPQSAPSGPGGTVVFPPVLVSNGQSEEFEFRAKLVTAGTCTNKAYTRSDKAPESSDSVVITSYGKPDLAMDKNCSPDAVAPGGVADCTLSIKNNGTAPAGSTTVTDVLDPGLTFVVGSATGPAGQPQVQGQTLTWTVSGVGVGQTVVIGYQQRVPSSGSGTVQYADTATASTPGDPNGGNNTDTEITTVTYPPTTTVDVYVNKMAPATAVPGAVVTHTLAFGNLGNATATGVKIVDTLGAGMTYQPGTATAVLDGVAFNPMTVQNGQVLTFTIGSVGAGKSGTISYKVKVAPTATSSGTKTLTDTAVISTTSPSPSNPGNDSSTATTLVNYQPALTLTKQGCRQTVVPGGFQTYTLSFSNTGTAPATGVQLVDTVPANQTIADAPGAMVNGQTATWNIGTLDPGATSSRELTTQVNVASGTVTNSAELKAANATPVTATSQTTVSNAGAATKGMAYELDVRSNLLFIPLVLANQLVKSSSSDPGGPTASAAGPVLTVNLPGVVSLGALSTTSSSKVNVGDATTTAVSTVGSTSLLGGLIKAKTIRGVAQSVAGPLGASSNTDGSTFQDLVINGTTYTDVAPNTPIVVKNALGVVVAEGLLYEVTKSAGLVSGKYTTKASVNMIRLTLKVALGGLGVGASVIVGHSESEATYPSGRPCGAIANTVSGKAFSAYVRNALLGLDTYVSRAEITPLGGSDSANVPVNVPGIVTTGTTTNTTSGSIGSPPTASSKSSTQTVNLLNGLVTADLVEVTSDSTATGAAADTVFGATFVNLKVGGQVIDLPIPPNTVINIPQPGGALVSLRLNERIENGDGTKNTEGTINALHLYVLKGSVLETEVIVGSAHSDAHIG